MPMLRVHLMQSWFGYSAMEEALNEARILRQFAGLSLERIPDETTILNFRRLLESTELAAGIVASGLLDQIHVTVAKVVDVTLVDKLLNGEEILVATDAGCTGIEKREELNVRQVIWQITTRRSTYEKHGKKSSLYKASRSIGKAKAQTRSKVEHPFRVIKRQFAYTKVRFLGLVKNTHK